MVKLFDSIKSRITFLFTLLLVTFIIILASIFGIRAGKELSLAYEQNSIDLLESINNHLITQHQSILFHKERTLNLRKMELKTNIDLVMNILESYYDEYKFGNMTLNEAKRKAISRINGIRYSNNVGYFWINDTGKPFPKMIMHPTLPELDNNILDDPSFNCALGREENLFKAFVDITEVKNEGYVDYLWPKPSSEGLTEIQPKISFVKIFKPWNWIIGTGLYIDDIDKEEQKRLDKVIEELNETIPLLKVGNHGYFYIFNENSDMLVHPNLRGTNIGNMVNPQSGELLTKDLIQAVEEGTKTLKYLWDKPGYEGEYRFKKTAFITYYEPLKWYIAASIYQDDLFNRLYSLIVFIVIVVLISIGLVFLASIKISNSLTKPLFKLINSIKITDKDGIPVNLVPDIKTKEFKHLQNTINNMIQSITISHNQLNDHKNNLEKLVRERTKDLELSLERLERTQDKLIESEKMASLGELVAGVAHEINTPVGIGVTAASHLDINTQSFSKLYKEGHLSKKEFEKYIELCLESSRMILSNMEKASKLIQNFKQVAVDQSDEEKREFAIDKYIDEILFSVYSKFKHTKHKIEVNAEPTIIINSYPGVLYQIIINLITNSLVHGFETIDSGLITINVKKIDDYIELTYRDTGKGIDRGAIKKIFDPFFTTKRGSGGSGLGLNIVYNLVHRKLGGTIECNSKIDKFTEFIITFPAF